ncbi:conjugal transfer/type IV secretion protein DotA/TraY [Ciceribacter lividus]|uniref:Conjugal transfer/type IV secretion protein DotA/TraY n=1 Tax=Ciceribacter lividus TaxID=1197950 RepID=A0A6I7HMA0_9HYPH|nr:DotA/TraY family protein [Ciceribacter lividus]RCW23181.1 conjugal transfer/type IV secretion protein DotA/TraY [Ciceribacter lividus]
MIDLLAEPPSTDIAWQIVNAVLPSKDTTMWGHVLQVFASVLFFLGGLFVAYQTVVGIVATAHTGQVLGNRWHQIWVPLRIVVGLGLLAPLPSTGFSSVHYILRDVVARAGINLANGLSGTGIKTVAEDGTTILPVSVDGSTVAMTVLQHEICAAVYNQAGDLWGWSARLAEPEGVVTEAAPEAGFGKVVTWSYGGTCGRFSYTVPENREAFTAVRREAVKALVLKLREEAQRYAKLAAETSGLSSAAAATNAVSLDILSPRLVQDIRAAGAAFDEAIAAAAKAEAAAIDTAGRSGLVKAAEQQGFLTTGMYWLNLSQVSSLTTSLSNERIENVQPRVDGDFSEALDRAFAALRLQLSGEAERVSLSANDFSAAGDETADATTKLLAPVARSIIEWAATPSDDKDKDAMGALVSSGHAMLAAAWAAIVAGGTIAAVSKNAVAEFFGSGGVNYLLDWSKWITGPVFLIGGLRAYVIPIMPHVFMIMSGVALLAALMEAMIALPLWCLRWLKMDSGDDFAGDSVRLGILFTVNIFLRPALAVLALFGAYGFFDVVLGALDSLWPTAFLAQTGGHVVGLLGFLFLTAIQTYMIWYSCIKGFGQIWALPDRVLTWFGLPGTAGESGLVSGAFGGMLALAGRGGLPKILPQAPSKHEKLKEEGSPK